MSVRDDRLGDRFAGIDEEFTSLTKQASGGQSEQRSRDFGFLQLGGNGTKTVYGNRIAQVYSDPFAFDGGWTVCYNRLNRYRWQNSAS